MPSSNKSTFEDIKGMVSYSNLRSIIQEKTETIHKIIKNKKLYYHPFYKRIKNKNRRIDNPQGILKIIQRKINNRILALAPLPLSMYGSVTGRDIVDNAVTHRGQKVVVSLDIKDCFPNTTYRMVFNTFRDQFKFSTKIASILTNLTTYRGYVPQGAPTSSALVNIVLSPMVIELEKYSQINKLKISIWVDDLVFSGDDADKNIFQIIEIVEKYGYSVRVKKIRVMRSNRLQQFTGLVVNKKISIPKNKIFQYKSDLEKFNDNSEYKNSGLLSSSIKGKLEYIKFVNKKQEERITRILLKNKSK